MMNSIGKKCIFLLVTFLIEFINCLPGGSSVSNSGSSVSSGHHHIPPKGCLWERIPYGDTHKDILSCKLRTISKAENLFGSLRPYEIEKISSLRLECSDVMFFESSLESVNFIGRLNKLKELTIEYCKIKYVPSLVLSGLRDLRLLTVRTHNTDWSAINLELHPESFRGLTELRQLDLADNNIWSVPTDVFCPLYSLRILNLTGNRLNDVSQLGFSDWGSNQAGPVKACNTGLEILDLSKNDITLLSDSSLSALRSLETLLLQDNHLSSLADHSFVGLQSLQIVNMSSNRLTALPPDLLRSSRKLRQIYIRNNSLAVLAPGLFEGLDRLETLDLSQNDLTSLWINRDTFSGLVRLVVLNLGHNSLTKIDQHIFKGLFSLQMLSLEYNSIEIIDENAFNDLKNLYALILSNNRLKRIEHHHFAELFVLNELLLETNSIEWIHPKSFDDLGKLKDLSLNDNLLNEIPESIRKLTFLQSLDLGKNEIKKITNNTFVGLNNLFGLRLVDNFITNITNEMFHTLPTLHILNLASNEIKFIHPDSFRANTLLKAIRLDDNEIENIDGIFKDLTELVWLNVSNNKIKLFNYNYFPKTLDSLNIEMNLIDDLGDYLLTNSGIHLTSLDASSNLITTITNASFPNTIVKLNLRNNRIDTIDPHTFFKKEFIKRVDLTDNRLKKIDKLSILLSPAVKKNDIQPEFYLKKNQLHCDCHIEWLQTINDLTHISHYPRIADLELIKCSLEGKRNYTEKLLIELIKTDFLCKYDSHCFSQCHCCDFDACDCKMICPDECTCYHDHGWTTNIVDCGNTDFLKVPEQIPMDVTTLYLDGNDLQELGSHLFIGKKKLQKLYLNNSRIVSVHNRTFNGLPNLEILHLENNQLNILHGYEFNQITTIKELYLDHNDLTDLGNETFKKLNSLKLLSLNENHINSFEPWKQLTLNNNNNNLNLNNKKQEQDEKIIIKLADNKFLCDDCDKIIKLKEWLNSDNLKNIYCLNNNNKTINDLINLCQKTITTTTNNNNNNDIPNVIPIVEKTILTNTTTNKQLTDYLTIIIVFILLLTIIILIIIICFIFRKNLCFLLYKKCGIKLFNEVKFPQDNFDDNEKLYDGYLIYSQQDINFIQDEIALELEQDGYSMCLHHRDIHSTAFLADSLQSASDASRKIILVPTINFLQLEWSDQQFRIALQAVLELIKPSRRRSKLIIILTAPPNVVSMDPIMDILLRTCTVICWGDRKFWEKLRYAMPEATGLKTVNQTTASDIRTSPNLRYTPAPTTLDMWYKRSFPGTVLPVPHQQTQSQQQQHNHHHHHLHNNHHQIITSTQTPTTTTTPSQSTYNTEDEMSSVSSQYYEQNNSAQPNLYNNRASLGHVYSTIPETPPPQRAASGGSGGGGGGSSGTVEACFV